MTNMIHAGLYNYINADKVLTVIDFTKTKPSPIKRAINDGKASGTVIDITQGRRTNSVIFMDGGRIILSMLSGTVITERIKEATNNA